MSAASGMGAKESEAAAGAPGQEPSAREAGPSGEGESTTGAPADAPHVTDPPPRPPATVNMHLTIDNSSLFTIKMRRLI